LLYGLVVQLAINFYLIYYYYPFVSIYFLCTYSIKDIGSVNFKKKSLILSPMNFWATIVQNLLFENLTSKINFVIKEFKSTEGYVEWKNSALTSWRLFISAPHFLLFFCDYYDFKKSHHRRKLRKLWLSMSTMKNLLLFFYVIFFVCRQCRLKKNNREFYVEAWRRQMTMISNSFCFTSRIRDKLTYKSALTWVFSTNKNW
jgi:hypothetical protein